MPVSEQLSELIGEIYDAALDASLWSCVLKKAARFIGGPSAAVWWKDSSRETGTAPYMWGFDSGYAQRVLLAVVEVGGVPEVAEALGISPTTVKTHLSRIFGKTGTRRQADLVKLVAGFASPLFGEPRT